MIHFDHVAVLNIENALRGARNPLSSWARSDSYYDETGTYVLGEADLGLAKRLANAGPDHRKYLRQIFVSADICAPLYWWKEFDTYKVGTVANSTSTMHKIHAKSIEMEDFSVDRLSDETKKFFVVLVEYLENLRLAFVQTGEKQYWDELIQLLPSSYNQTRTVTMNYENLSNMYHARKNHKLAEWREFCADFVTSLPYAQAFIVRDRAED